MSRTDVTHFLDFVQHWTIKKKLRLFIIFVLLREKYASFFFSPLNTEVELRKCSVCVQP